ncbi:MAG: hypothetical protein DME79_03490 [Verrucomicrobia bacterium]|nr:MAG: hypothetical protein DME79_03490 [Verrucomicrobiota bacterium]
MPQCGCRATPKAFGVGLQKILRTQTIHAIRFEVISIMEDDAFPSQMAPSGGANRQGNAMKLAI